MPKCPQCGEELTRDVVDVGVGDVPVGPWGCENCHYVESRTDLEVRLDDELWNGKEE